MAYEILVLDIDGTVTNSQKIITPKTKEALIHLQENGQKVVLASGRSEYGFLHLAEELRLAEYGGFTLSFNGAKITECKTKKIIYNATLPQEIVAEIYESAVEHKVGIAGYEDNVIVSGNGLDAYIEFDAKVCHMKIKEVDHFVDNFSAIPLNKCLMSGEPEHMAEVETVLKKRFEDRISVYRSEGFFLELMPMGVDKAYALSRLLYHLGLNRKQMICCGDGYNDLSMIQYAGLGVAMANAKEEVKKVADYITLSNDEDGIVAVIEKFMLAK